MNGKKKSIKEIFQDIIAVKNEEADGAIQNTKQKFGVPTLTEKNLLGLASIFNEDNKLL